MGANTRQIDEVSDSLLRIEIELRRLEMWSERPPSPEALQSSQPFCIDTLEFTEWLQFVFIHRMKVLIENDHPLPNVSGMAPMAEEHFRTRKESGDRLVQELGEMDRLLSSDH